MPQMYCDFAPKLFKEFTSMKVKIKPQISDDWKIIPQRYGKIGGFSLKSNKLNQQVADIDVLRFLKFCERQDVLIKGLNLKGEYIIGNDRSVYTKDMYNDWKEKYHKRTEIIIPKKDYIAGHEYLTACGAKVTYLGKRYVSSMKPPSNSNSNPIDSISKIALKYYVISGNYVTELKQKLIMDLTIEGNATPFPDADEELQTRLESNKQFVYIGITKPSLEEYETYEKELNENATFYYFDTKTQKMQYRDTYNSFLCKCCFFSNEKHARTRTYNRGNFSVQYDCYYLQGYYNRVEITNIYGIRIKEQ